jgi:GT2 family glycosyltransferase
MYIEDADLTRRFLQISKTAYYPEAVVYHHFAKGSHKNWKLTWYSIHGAYIYFNKWGWLLNNK